MSTLHYKPASFTVSTCSSMAFKDGKAYGTCLKYQQAIHGQKRSSQQSAKVWHR